MKPIQTITTVLFGLALVCLSACTVAVDPPQPSVCLSHPHDSFVQGDFSCDDATAPSCAFNAQGDPTALEPSGLVDSVCHCVGGRYSCWGRVR
jgi:hypothetical protein